MVSHGAAELSRTGALAHRRDQPVLTIEPPKGRASINWGELWVYRELLYFLTWRDVKVRYKQTALGATWAILQPVMTMIVFTVFFGKLAGLEGRTGDVPYPIYVFTGLLPWTFFANAITNSSNSVLSSINLITKVYFPRLIIPLSAVGVSLVDFGVSCVVLLGMMVLYKTAVTAQLLLLPLFLVGTVLCAAGIGSLLSAMIVAYRDFRYVVPFLIQIWMYVTPVIYPSSIVPERWRWVFSLNPMAGLIDGYRAALLGTPLQWGPIGLSLAMSAAVFFAGVYYYRSVERKFADII